MQQPELALPVRYASAALAPAHPPFDYGALDTGAASQLRSCADTIRSYQSKVTKQIIAIGEILLAVKKALEHGQFGEWLGAEFGWSERTAQNYMRAAETFRDKSETVADLAPTTIYALASPSTPEPVRVAVVERLEQGERVTHDEIKSLIRRGKADARAEREDAKRTPEEKAKRKKAEERRKRELEKSRTESDERRKQQRDAERAAAKLIVERLGDDVAQILDLLGKNGSVYALDIKEARDGPAMRASAFDHTSNHRSADWG